MGTNVYLTTRVPGPVDLTLNFAGPSSTFDDGYSLLTNQVPGSTNRTKVLSIDRGGGLHPGMIQSTTELTLSWAGQYLGSLVVLLSNLQEPIKNAIDWSLRGPTPAAFIDFASDYTAHETAFELPDASVRLTVTGVSTAWFDDIDLKVEVTPRHVVRLLTARDPAQQITLSAFIDDLGRAWRQDLRPDGTWTARRIIEVPAQRHTIDLAVALSFAQQREPLVLGVTLEGTLWWRDSTIGGEIPLKLPDGQAGALTVSDVQFSGTDQHIEIVTTVKQASGVSLWRRILKLSSPPTFDGDWSGWGATTGRGCCYVPATATRSVLAISPGTLTGIGIYSSTANAGSEWWGRWTATFDLPSGVEPKYLTGTPWFDGLSPKQWAAIITASDGRIYLTSMDATRTEPWDPSPFAGTTVPASLGLGVAQNGYAVVLAVAGGSVWLGAAIVKENRMSWYDTKIKAAGMHLLAPYVANGTARALVADTTGLTLRSVALGSGAAVEDGDEAEDPNSDPAE